MNRNQLSLSATNLAVHHHLNCDLYIHNVYHNQAVPTPPSFKEVSEHQLVTAQYQRGIDWETTLYSWLDNSNLLLKVPSMPMEAEILIENIQADDRDHFFIAGMTFRPPEAELNKHFAQTGTQPVKFGLAKPDLLEITRTNSGIKWKVIDAKASKFVKTSHHVQIYFYTLCLNNLLRHTFFQSSGAAGIWLPPDDGFHAITPSTEDIKTIDISLLSPSLDSFLFQRLPRILAAPRSEVSWHFNPLCHGCKYETDCKSRALDNGELGSMSNISINDARTLRELLNISSLTNGWANPPHMTDIEDLHELIADPARVELLERRSPMVLKKAKRILALPGRKSFESKKAIPSPTIEAARTNAVQVIPRRNYTCPSREDIAVIISLIQDPSSPKPNVEYFSLTTFQGEYTTHSRSTYGKGIDLVPSLAVLIRSFSSNRISSSLASVQFYVWSSTEQSLLQAHLINVALTSGADRQDLRLCIGALSQGASLLQTAFQPLLLSGALLSFLGKGKRTMAEYQACLERMDLSTNGTVPELRNRVIQELQRLQSMDQSITQKKLGQLPRVAVLKKEVESLLVLPIPGYWDIQECVSALLETKELSCPNDEDVYDAFKRFETKDLLHKLLSTRNRCIYAILDNLRTRVVSNDISLLVNEAKTLSTSFMDICRQDHLSKLFFMQQFEVLAKLTQLWNSRMDGCPDAPVLEYRSDVPGSKGLDHTFRLLSGTLDAPASDKDRAFYDKLLTEDINSDTEIPVEALFDDLAVSGLVFPLNRYTNASWETQHPIVQQKIEVADVRNAAASRGGLIVTLRIWGTTAHPFIFGRHYRLSPRLVDFNTTKVLSSLFELDWRWEAREDKDDAGGSEEDDHHGVPFLQLIINPKSFGKVHMATESLKVENDIQRLFRDLKNLDNEHAGSLLLKPSQHRAAKRLITNRLSVIWGPPGTGKTHTIALSILRLLEVQWRLDDKTPKIIFITAMTHAAIDACQTKLQKLVNCYQAIEALPSTWLSRVKIERVLKGSEHPAPSKNSNLTHIYAGTLYQLYNFTKAVTLNVDCVVADEAGQIALASLSLVLRCLTSTGRIIIAGDSEQLAPILTGNYPHLKTMSLFGSVLDCVMFSPSRLPIVQHDSQADDLLPSSQSTVIQLTENFRLNPDLGEFVSTIYARQFKPQKVQARQLATALKKVKRISDRHETTFQPNVLQEVQKFLIGLSDVMLRQPQTVLERPRRQMIDVAKLETACDGVGMTLSHYPVSLSLLRLKTWSAGPNQFGYELHVHGEAAVAAALITCLQRCLPEDDIFVATPHRVQREAVKAALSRLNLHEQESLENAFESLEIESRRNKVTVDTIERLQGSEASFVICLFSLPASHTTDLGFLLERRRLNVAISRAKTLCILVASSEILCPPVTVFANEETAKGFAFLKAFEERAWSYDISVNLDSL